MLFSSADYPLFLGAVFFLYALSRMGAWPGVLARWAVMLLLGDLVFVLLTKDVTALWDPLGGGLYRLIVDGSDPTSALPPIEWWKFIVGAVVTVGGLSTGYWGGGMLSRDTAQRWLARIMSAAIAGIGVVVLVAHRNAVLPDVTHAIGGAGHVGYLLILTVAIGASSRPNGRAFGQLLILGLVSCVFYQAWAMAMPGAYQYLLALLLFTILLDYYLAIAIENAQRPWLRRLLLLVSIASNLGILCVFKYYDFFTQDVLHLKVSALHLILPAGISFHTFQSLSYTVDVYRRELRATRSPIQFATFVLFFPQLVAGPIVRATELMPQLETLPKFNKTRAADGLFRIIVGRGKKIAIADFLAIAIVDRVFEAPSHFSSVEVMVGVVAYAFQIYLDFSAYSDIAIGSAQLLGFTLPENFETPYRSGNLQDFWRRWHMSLSRWLRDYVYIPLGGSRAGEARAYLNLMATMLLGGLWHGASWAFVVWGALHGAGLAITRVFQRRADKPNVRMWPVLVGTAVVAVAGIALLRSDLMDDLPSCIVDLKSPWALPLSYYALITPLWAALTAWLSKPAIAVPAVAPPPSQWALAFRVASIGVGAGLLYAMYIGEVSSWILLAEASWSFAVLADLVANFRGIRQLGRDAVRALGRVLSTMLVFQYVCVAWIFFRASSFDNALDVLHRIADIAKPGELESPNVIPTLTAALVIATLAHAFPDGTFAWIRQRFIAAPQVVQALLLVGVVFVLREFAHPHIVPFIYFQF